MGKSEIVATGEEPRPVLDRGGAGMPQPRLPTIAVSCSLGAVFMMIGTYAMLDLVPPTQWNEAPAAAGISLVIGSALLWVTGLILAVISALRRQRPPLVLLAILLFVVPVLLNRLNVLIWRSIQQ